MDKWDSYFMHMAKICASLSKDLSTKLGCVIIDKDRGVRSTGFNSFCRGINDNDASRQERPKKYLFFEHAERNAIYLAARNGISLRDCIIYCAWPPCADCARAIISVGIIEVVYEEETPPERWSESLAAAKEMLSEAGVVLRRTTSK